jgi:hypothetical protein
MKLRYMVRLAIAASVTAIGFAPLATAATTTVQKSPDNTQITVTPGRSAQNAARLQQPFGGNSSALLFHH